MIETQTNKTLGKIIFIDIEKAPYKIWVQETKYGKLGTITLTNGLKVSAAIKVSKKGQLYIIFKEQYQTDYLDKETGQVHYKGTERWFTAYDAERKKKVDITFADLLEYLPKGEHYGE